jgi:hypothetical protein
VAIFLDEVTSPAVFDNVMGRADDEELRLGRREIYVRYGAGMTASKLRIPAATKASDSRGRPTVLTRLAAGGNRIRTIGPATESGRRSHRAAHRRAQDHDPSRNDVAISNRRWRQASIIMIANSPSAGSWA